MEGGDSRGAHCLPRGRGLSCSPSLQAPRDGSLGLWGVSQGGGAWPRRPSRSRLPEEPGSQSGFLEVARRFRRSGRQLGWALQVTPASSTAQSRVSSTVSAHTCPFLGAASGGSPLSWAWPASGSAGEEGLALRGGGGVPIHQKLYGDLEGPTSRPNGAESGTDMLFPPSHPVPPRQATVSSCSPSLEALGTAASPFPLALRWPGGAHFPLFLRAFAQAESGPPLPCRCLTPFFSCRRFKWHLRGPSLSFYTKTAPGVTPGRFSPQCPAPPRSGCDRLLAGLGAPGPLRACSLLLWCPGGVPGTRRFALRCRDGGGSRVRRAEAATHPPPAPAPRPRRIRRCRAAARPGCPPARAGDAAGSCPRSGPPRGV